MKTHRPPIQNAIRASDSPVFELIRMPEVRLTAPRYSRFINRRCMHISTGLSAGTTHFSSALR
jgi:hypothetical protein